MPVNWRWRASKKKYLEREYRIKTAMLLLCLIILDCIQNKKIYFCPSPQQIRPGLYAYREISRPMSAPLPGPVAYVHTIAKDVNKKEQEEVKKGGEKVSGRDMTREGGERTRRRRRRPCLSYYNRPSGGRGGGGGGGGVD